MKIHVVLVFFLSAILLVEAAQAQSKPKPARKTTAVKAQPLKEDPPPPLEALPDFEKITFDTTAVVEDAFTVDIRRLMEVMQFRENLVTTVSSALDQNTAQWPDDFKTAFKNRFMQELTAGPGMQWMANIFIKAYRDNFSKEEIAALVQFYQTEAGKKFIEKSPALTLNIMQQSQKIGEYIGYKVGKELANENSKK